MTFRPRKIYEVAEQEDFTTGGTEIEFRKQNSKLGNPNLKPRVYTGLRGEASRKGTRRYAKA
jgi:hypothetical protein